jgi:hypothetical protein
LIAPDCSTGIDLWKHAQKSVWLEGDVQNLNNCLNLTNFAELFSGNAVVLPRSYFLGLQAVI